MSSLTHTGSLRKILRATNMLGKVGVYSSAQLAKGFQESYLVLLIKDLTGSAKALTKSVGYEEESG